MMDIVERLRNNKGGESYTWQTISEAANEIERLREAAKDRPKDRPNEAADEIERLREALKQIASTTKIITFENDQLLPALHLLVLNNLKIARAALKEGE